MTAADANEHPEKLPFNLAASEQKCAVTDVTFGKTISYIVSTVNSVVIHSRTIHKGKPKVTNANLFHLLEPSTSSISFGDGVFGYEETDDLMVAFASFYLRHLERALSRGVERCYVEEHEALAGVRGRVEVGLVARRAGLPLPVDCRYDEHSADTQLNRLLAGAAERAARWPRVSPIVRTGLRRCLSVL